MVRMMTNRVRRTSIMSKRNFNKQADIQAAFKTLRQYNQYVIFPVSEDAFNDPLLEEYFEKPLDDTIEAKVEKILSVAAVRTVYDNPNIPDSKKEAIAKKNAREIREAMRIAKLEYHAQIKGNVTVKEYKRRKAIPIVAKAARIKRLTKTAKNLTIKGLVRVIAGPVASVGITVGRFDEVYFVDFPGAAERKEILIKMVAPYRGDSSSVFDFSDITDEACGKIVESMKGTLGGFSGAEIKSVVNMVIEKKFMEYANMSPERKKAGNTRVKVTVDDFKAVADDLKASVMANHVSKKDPDTGQRRKTNIERIKEMQDHYGFKVATSKAAAK